MFGQIWQWLKGLWQKLLGKSSKRQQESQKDLPQLNDTDYEFLFSQLLEGVVHGWHEGRIVKFFAGLEDRGKQGPWVAWLQRFGNKVLASEASNHQLGMRMVQLGEKCRSVTERDIDQIGETAYSIGRELLTRQPKRDIWEYDGPDNSSLPSETMTVEELIARLGQDSQFREAMARQLGVEITADPQAIVQALIPATNMTPKTYQDWFDLGLQQADNQDYTSAVASWEKALALNPNLPKVWHNRGCALAYLGQYTDAIASFSKAIELEPKNYQAWHDLGNAFYSIQKWEDALASYDKALEIKPDFALAQSKSEEMRAKINQSSNQ